MRRSLALLVTAPLLAPLAAVAASTELGSTTILRLEQRAVTGQPKQDLLPATQFLSIDATNLADGNLSLHLAGWGRVDLADKSYNDNSLGGSFTYGYLHYRLRPANTDLRAGRFFIREGIISEQVDGVSARTDLPYGFSLSAFGGAPVHTRHLAGENSDGKGNSIFGGRAAYRYQGMLELGVAGIYEGSAPNLALYDRSPEFNSLKDRKNHRLIGGDFWLSPIWFLEMFGHTSYNPETSKIAEQTYLVNLKSFKHLIISGEFNEHRELSFLGTTWVRFPGSPIEANEQSRSMGGSVSYEINPAVEVTADYKHYYRSRLPFNSNNTTAIVSGNADRFGGDIKLNFLKNSLNNGFAYHYLDAGKGFGIGDNSSASYHELRAYALYDTKTYFAAIDVIDYLFKEKVDNESSAWEAKVSLGYYLLPNLALSGDLSYGRNPENRDETKGLLRLTYNTTFDGKGGKK